MKILTTTFALILSLNGFAHIICNGIVLERDTLFVMDQSPIDFTMLVSGEPMESESNPASIRFFDKNNFVYLTEAPSKMVFGYKFDLLNGQVSIGKVGDSSIKKISDVDLLNKSTVEDIKMEVLETAQISCQEM